MILSILVYHLVFNLAFMLCTQLLELYLYMYVLHDLHVPCAVSAYPRISKLGHKFIASAPDVWQETNIHRNAITRLHALHRAVIDRDISNTCMYVCAVSVFRRLRV